MSECEDCGEETRMKIHCPKCKSPNVYQQEGEHGCMMCGERWPIVFKSCVKSDMVVVPGRKAKEVQPKAISYDYKTEREFMKNKLGDLNNHLFEQLERLNSENLKGARLSEEITRAKAVTGLAREIILNGKLALDALVAVKVHGILPLPKILEIGSVQEDKK